VCASGGFPRPYRDYTTHRKSDDDSWLPFDEARALVQEMNLESRVAWDNLCRENKVPETVPTDPNRVYHSSGWISWMDWLGIVHSPVWRLWSKHLSADDPSQNVGSVLEHRTHWLYSMTLKAASKSSHSPLAVAQSAAVLGPCMGLDAFDTLEACIFAPELLNEPPSELAAAVLFLQDYLPAEADPSRIICIRPDVLTTARKKKYKTIKAMEDLRFLLPETCVAWLLQEEPWLLHGVPAHRLEQLGMTGVFHQPVLAEIGQSKDIYKDADLRTWFKTEFVEPYFGLDPTAYKR